jgi:hypothetical protein
MRLKTLALMLIAAGVAARAYSRSQRQSGPDGSGAERLSSGSDDALSSSSTDAFNAGERLRRDLEAAAPKIANTPDEDPFSSDSQRGAYARGNGLADFSRGA